LRNSLDGYGRIKALVVAILIVLIVLPAYAEAYAGGLVTFAVRRSPLRITLRAPATPVRGEPVAIRVIVKNAGGVSLSHGRVSLRALPGVTGFRTGRTFRVIGPHARRVFEWRVTFPRARAYTLTAVGRAQRLPTNIYIDAARKRLSVKKQTSVLGRTLALLTGLPDRIASLKALILP